MRINYEHMCGFAVICHLSIPIIARCPFFSNIQSQSYFLSQFFTLQCNSGSHIRRHKETVVFQRLKLKYEGLFKRRAAVSRQQKTCWEPYRTYTSSHIVWEISCSVFQDYSVKLDCWDVLQLLSVSEILELLGKYYWPKLEEIICLLHKIFQIKIFYYYLNCFFLNCTMWFISMMWEIPSINVATANK